VVVAAAEPLDDVAQGEEVQRLVGLAQRQLRVDTPEGITLEDDVAMGEQRALGGAGGARCVDDDGHVAGLGGGDALLPDRGMLACVGLAQSRKLLERHDLRVLEVAQPVHVEHDNPLQARRALANAEDLVELLLVLHEQELGGAVVDEVLHLGGRIRRIDAGRDACRAQYGEVAEQPLLVVVGEDRRAVAGLQPERDQAHADRLGARAVLLPSIGLPDTAVLLAHRHLGGLGLHAVPE
jgi:hypothetical protein